MTDPFARLPAPIPVTVTTSPDGLAGHDGTAVIVMQPSHHDHAAGVECIACATAADIRAALFDLLQAARDGQRPMFARVVVDAGALPDPQDVIDRLTPGKVPALGLRDHAVLRNFRLVGGP